MSLKLNLGICGITLTGLGILLLLTNPGSKEYQSYASQALNSYLKDNACTQLPPEISSLLKSHCHSLVDSLRPQLAQIIDRQTIRQNFILFSIYQTDLSLPSTLPDYQVKTLGVFKQFYIYESEQL